MGPPAAVRNAAAAKRPERRRFGALRARDRARFIPLAPAPRAIPSRIRRAAVRIEHGHEVERLIEAGATSLVRVHAAYESRAFSSPVWSANRTSSER
jgi:hypothetical protein